jgi:hypothetical protein
VEKAKLYLKKYGWILLAVTVGLGFTFLWLVANAGKGKKAMPARPTSLDTPLPAGAPDLQDPEEITVPEVELAPFTRYINNARRVDEQIKARKDLERITDAAGRYE